jgi:hypothetical protein
VTAIRAIGIDVGPTPGLVGLLYKDNRLTKVDVIQCSAGMLDFAFRALLMPYVGATDVEIYAQAERFVIGTKSMRTGSPGARTRDMVGEVAQLAAAAGVHLTLRSAMETKAWATDRHLTVAGLIAPTKGMAHARDGARHALYTAVQEGKVLNPLSRKARRTDG